MYSSKVRKSALISLLYLHRIRKLRKKRAWVRSIFQQRKTLGEFHCLIQEMRLNDHESFFRYFRMTPARFDHLLSIVGPGITKQETNYREPISPAQRLAITLRYIATGDSMQTVSFSYRVGKSTVSQIIRETTSSIWLSMQPIYLQPPDQQECFNISRKFSLIWNYPNALGAIDGKHCNIWAPKNCGSDYYNYKKSHSVVLLAVADAAYRFLMVDIGSKGRFSDGGIFASSEMKEYMENVLTDQLMPALLPNSDKTVPYVFLADEAFPLKPYLMRPYPSRSLSDSQRIYNYRHSRARRVVENAFGILASRWRVFLRPMHADISVVKLIIQAACCLHNYLKALDNSREPQYRYCPPGFSDVPNNDGTFTAGQWRNDVSGSSGLLQIGQLGSNMHSHRASEIRDTFSDYFVNEGSIPWQVNVVRRGV